MDEKEGARIYDSIVPAFITPSGRNVLRQVVPWPRARKKKNPAENLGREQATVTCGDVEQAFAKILAGLQHPVSRSLFNHRESSILLFECLEIRK